MNKVVFAVSISLACAVFAAPPKRGPITAQDMIRLHREMDEEANANSGGYLVKPGSQQGEIVFVNCQKKAEAAWIGEVAEYCACMSKFKITTKDGAFDFASPKIEGNASVFIVDDPRLPVLLVAPESRWGVVNVGIIGKERRPAFFQARTKKELARCFAYLCGAGSSNFKGTLVRGIEDQPELDKNIDYQLPMDVIGRFKSYMEPFGVRPAARYTYKRACEQGWAPQPTNDIQKAIWDKVHAIPQKPIKIEYNEKRDKGK